MCKFFILQNEHIVRIIDAKIIDTGPRSVCILMELGEMDFNKYLQSPAPGSGGIMPHSQGQGHGFDGNSR